MLRRSIRLRKGAEKNVLIALQKLIEVADDPLMPLVDAWFVGINTTHRAESVPSQPWGPRFFARSTGSEIVVNGGKLVAHEGLRISTTDSGHPGALRLKGKATLTSRRDSEFRGLETTARCAEEVTMCDHLG